MEKTKKQIERERAWETRKKNPNWKEQVTNASKTAAKNSHKSGRMKNGQAREMGLKSRKFENEVADSLDYENIFLPQSVCDRIAIVDGKPILIEIKHKGDKLRPKQKQAQKLLGDSYVVIERWCMQ